MPGPTTPKIEWCTTRETAARVEPAAFDGLELNFSTAAEPPLREAHAAILDTAAFADLRALAARLDGTFCPVLIRAHEAEVEPVLRELRDTDDICRVSDPEQLVAHRIRAMLKRSTD